MKKILVAGSTGYLGQYIVKELKSRKYWVRVLIRNESQKKLFSDLTIDDFFIGEVTNPKSLYGLCNDIDVVFSSIGITRQKDGLTYMDVDYKGNSNLLNEALINNVKLFQYVSAIGGESFRKLKIFEAKEMFVDELKSSGLNYTIFRPSGFFSDMKDFMDMAKKGNVFLFGNGCKRLNPIHGNDLAHACVDSISKPIKELNIGGPEVLSQKEIGALALQSLNKEIKITFFPDFIRKLTIFILRIFTTSKFYGPIEFFLSVMGSDNIGEKFGEHKLKDFFENEAQN